MAERRGTRSVGLEAHTAVAALELRQAAIVMWEESWGELGANGLRILHCASRKYRLYLDIQNASLSGTLPAFSMRHSQQYSLSNTQPARATASLALSSTIAQLPSMNILFTASATDPPCSPALTRDRAPSCVQVRSFQHFLSAGTAQPHGYFGVVLHQVLT